MKIILQEQDRFVLRFDQDEEVVEGIKNFSIGQNIKSGYFFGVGAVKEATLSYYDIEAKAYRDRILKERLEIISFMGNASWMGEELVIHGHGSFSNAQYQVTAGHVKKMVISATCEVIFHAFENRIERQFDEKSGLNLLQ